MEITPIAKFRSPFATKFGVPKQSGLVSTLRGEIVFEPAYRSVDALRGLDGYDYLWLVWAFSANRHAAVSPTVRPPLLGGNERMGVFATRSPFRPNPIGLSSVRLDRIELDTPHGPVVHVLGADLMDDTPIFDIKPYIAYADSHPDARGGFVDAHPVERLRVVVDDAVARMFDGDDLETLKQALALDPRPHYHADEQRTYGMAFMGKDVRFIVSGGVLSVLEALDLKDK